MDTFIYTQRSSLDCYCKDAEHCTCDLKVDVKEVLDKLVGILSDDRYDNLRRDLFKALTKTKD